MLHRSVRLGYALCVVLGALLAFLTFNAFDEFSPVDADFQVRVDQSMTSGTATEARAAVNAVARDAGVDIAKFVTDVENPEGVTHFYAAVGREDAEVSDRLAHGYRGFSRNTDVRYHSIDELGPVDPRGYYFVWGSQDDAKRLLDELRDFGMDGFVAPVPGVPNIGAFFLSTPLGWAFGIAGLAIIVLAGSGAIMAAPGYGIQRLQGRSYCRILTRDLRDVGPTLAVTLAVVGTVLALGLGLYNGYARIGDFSAVLLGFVCVLWLACVLSHAVALALLFRASILDAVKGKFAARWATAATYAVRVPATVLTVLVALGCVQAVVQLEERRVADEAWSRVADASYLLVSGTADALDDPTIFPRIGAMAREAIADREGVLASNISRDVTQADPARGSRAAPEGSCPVLLVSPGYVADRSVEAGDGTQIGDIAADQVTVLRSPVCGADVSQGIEDYVVAAADGTDSDVPSIVTQEIAPGQRFFTYGDKWNPDAGLWAQDAAIVVVPPELTLLSDDTYGSLVSTGEVFFASQSDALDRVASAGLDDQISGALLVSQAAADLTRQISLEFRTTATSLIAAIGVLIVTAVALVAIHARSRGQEIYVRYISGWTFWRTAWPILLIELCLAIFSVLWAVNRGVGVASQPGVADAIRGDITAWYGGIACASAVAGWCLVLALLRSASTRVVRSRSADA